MSIGINDMQQAWQNFNGSNPGWNTMGVGGGGGGGNFSMSMGGGGGAGGFAGLQTPSSVQNTQNAMSGQANIPGINQIEMPSWMNPDANANMGELLDTYSGIGAAFDPSGQVAARNAAIGYNTSAGTQAANNAATEYSNRAAQSGASGLGAGAVKAQAMMPMLSQNAALKIDAADTAAKTHQQGATLAAQIAGTIGELRTSYLGMLTGYAQGQQQLGLEKYKAEQSSAQGAASTALGYAQLQADQYKNQMAMSQQESDQKRLAATALLGAQGPSGNYGLGNQGQVMYGQNTYDAMKNWGSSKSAAQNSLLGML